MDSTFFIDKHLIRELQRDAKKRASLQEKEREHIKKFEQQVDSRLVLKLFDYIKSSGFERDKKSVDRLEGRLGDIDFSQGEALEILDLYEIYI